MSGFPSSFPDPTPQDIDRYQALCRMADPNGHASPNEMNMARRKMEEMEAKFPKIRLHSPDKSKPTPPPQPQFDTAAWIQSMLNQVQTKLQDELNKVQDRAADWADDAEFDFKVSQRTGVLTLTVKIPPDLLETVMDAPKHERALFAGEIGTRLSDTLQELLNEDE